MTPASLRGKPLSELKKHLNACGSAAFIEFSAVPSTGDGNTSRIIARTCRRIIRLQTHPLSDLLLQAALEIHRNTPSLVLPFLKTAGHLPRSRNRVLPWLQKLKNLTIAVPAIARLLIEKTPAAIEIFGGECLENWTRMAVDAAAGKLDGPVKAYLEESTNTRCFIPLSRWEMILKHAASIARVSPRGVTAFVRYGHKACRGLDDEGIAAWVSRGAAMNLGEPALFNYFLGASAESEKTISALLPKMRLDDSRRLLSLLCKALLDREVSIKSNSALHGVKGFSGGAATDGQTLFLPERTANFETFKLMALHQAAFLRHEHREVRKAPPPTQDLLSHLEADRWLAEMLPGVPRTMKWLCRNDLPQTYPRVSLNQIPSPPVWWGDFLPTLAIEKDQAIQQLKERAGKETRLPPELVDALINQLSMQMHGDVDGVWDMLKAMIQEIGLQSPDPEDLDENAETFLYREWDHNISAYRPSWCMVRQIPPLDDPNDFVAEARQRLRGTITLIRRQFLRLKPEESKKLRAQTGGDEIDLDAMVRALTDRKSGTFPSERFYIRREKRVRDVSALFLLDMSNSMEEKTNGSRMIDIQKDAMVIMAEALEAIGDPFAIFGFSSEGRFRVNLYAVKTFQEPYSDQVRFRIGNIEPKKLTRLGAVIRHGTFQLSTAPSPVRILIIFTDGKPFDRGYGNLNYAVADTMKAVRETKKDGVHPFLITSDTDSSGYLDKIIPESQRLVLQHPAQLPALMPQIYKRLTL